MFNEKVAALLNEQINKELYSAYLYWDISSYFTKRGLDGFAHWYMIQAQEERDHALIFYNFLHDNDLVVKLLAIAPPDKQYDCILDVLKLALEHEQYVTESINKIYYEAFKHMDLRTMEFLNWFVHEQAEEETNARNLITKLENFSSDPKSLYLLDQELGSREYKTPDILLN